MLLAATSTGGGVLQRQLQALGVAFLRGHERRGGVIVGIPFVWISVVLQQQLHTLDVAMKHCPLLRV